MIALLCLTVFLGNYSVIKKIHVFNGGLKVRTAICYGFGDYKSPGLIGRTFFYDGLQIRRDGWRGMERLARGGFQGTKKSRGILEGESPRQLKLQRPV